MIITFNTIQTIGEQQNNPVTLEQEYTVIETINVNVQLKLDNLSTYYPYIRDKGKTVIITNIAENYLFDGNEEDIDKLIYSEFEKIKEFTDPLMMDAQVHYSEIEWLIHIEKKLGKTDHKLSKELLAAANQFYHQRQVDIRLESRMLSLR